MAMFTFLLDADTKVSAVPIASHMRFSEARSLPSLTLITFAEIVPVGIQGTFNPQRDERIFVGVKPPQRRVTETNACVVTS